MPPGQTIGQGRPPAEAPVDTRVKDRLYEAAPTMRSLVLPPGRGAAVGFSPQASSHVDRPPRAMNKRISPRAPGQRRPPHRRRVSSPALRRSNVAIRLRR